MQERNIADALAEHLPRPATVITNADIPGGGQVAHVALPKGFELKKVDNEDLLEHPRRAKTNATLSDHTSFLAYVRQHATLATKVWCDFDPQTFRLAFTAVIDGTKSVTVLGNAGQLMSSASYDVASGILVDLRSYTNFNAWNQPGRVTYLDGTSEDTTFGCCGPESTTDRTGLTTSHTYDELKRETARTAAGISQLLDYDASSRLVRARRQGTNGSVITLRQLVYDNAGRLKHSTNTLGDVTTFLYGTNSYGGSLETVSYPDGGTVTNQHSREGRLEKTTGTAVHPVRFDYGVEQDGGVWRIYSKEIKLDSAGSDRAGATESGAGMLPVGYPAAMC